MNRRGSVLAHVLITGVIVAVLAASLLRMVLLNYVATQRAAGGAQERKEAEGGFARLMTVWNAANAVCSDGGGYSCTNAAGTCDCVCTPADSQDPVIEADDSTGVCQVEVRTVDGP